MENICTQGIEKGNDTIDRAKEFYHSHEFGIKSLITVGGILVASAAAGHVFEDDYTYYIRESLEAAYDTYTGNAPGHPLPW